MLRRGCHAHLSGQSFLPRKTNLRDLDFQLLLYQKDPRTSAPDQTTVQILELIKNLGLKIYLNNFYPENLTLHDVQ